MDRNNDQNANNISELLHDFRQRIMDNSFFSIGIPINLNLDYHELSDFFDLFLNNIGDPLINRSRDLSSRKFEQEVLNFFAKLYHSSEKECWGYVTSGGTEGNMYGLWMGRERYPDGILYYSEDSHYSIPKTAHLLRMKAVVIPSSSNGEINYEALDKHIGNNPSNPVILNLNIGTTMKGAIDNIDRILEILKKRNVTQYHIHCDAALFGMMLPFITDTPQLSLSNSIDSIAISGHKFIGSPIPCGVVLTKAKFLREIEQEVEYIQTSDTTITGSRNGHTPLVLWYAIKTKGYEGFRQEVQICLQNARYCYERLQSSGYQCILNKYSNIICLKVPRSKVIEKWRLLSQGEWAHVVVMQHVTKEKIDKFIDELSNDT